MITSVDYYTLLGVPRTASVADIRTAHKREVRIWRKRASSSSVDNVSGEAQRRLSLLGEALSVLSDTQRRAVYDRQTIAAPIEPPSSAMGTEIVTHDWREQAEEYLARADYQAAAQLARKVTTDAGNLAEGWDILARAHAGLQRLNDAIYEARRAIELTPTNALYHFNLGTFYEELGQWDDALRAYEQAAQLEPALPLFQLAIGGVWLQTNQLDQALSIVKQVYSASPNDEMACYYYAQVLIALAEEIPRDKSEEGYAVTSAGEIEEMRSYLDSAMTIKHLDQETEQTIHAIESYLSKMEAYTFHIPLGATSFAWEMMGPGLGCYGTIMMMLMLAAIAFAPLLLLFWGFGLLTGGSIGGGLLILSISIGLGYVWYRAIWVPQWKVNARRRDHRVRNLS